MTFTFKLARRWARLRLVGLALPAAAALHACGSGDGSSATEPNLPDSSSTGKPIKTVDISPDSVAIRANEVARFSATATSPDGRTVPVRLEWHSTGGTIVDEGAFRAPAPGTYRVIAMEPRGDLADTAVVVVKPRGPEPPLGGGGGLYPNEPAGFRRVVEHGFDSRALGPTALAGEWDEPHSPLFTHRGERSAPHSGPGVLQFRWPAHSRAGVSPGSFRAWDDLDVGRATRYGELYVSMRARVLGADFENQSVGTKLWYVAYGNTTHTNDGFIYLQGAGRQAKLPAMRILAQMSSQDVGASTPYPQNVTGAPLFTVGEWHHVEVYLRAGTPGRRDGVVRVWVDGVKVTDYTAVKFLDPANNYTQGFFQWQWTPVWGGNNQDRRTRDDHMQIDHVYISGR